MDNVTSMLNGLAAVMSKLDHIKESGGCWVGAYLGLKQECPNKLKARSACGRVWSNECSIGWVEEVVA